MQVHSIQEFLDYFERVRQRTRRVVVRIPEARLEWSPGNESFTPGDLVRHLAGAERWMWAESVQGRPSRYPGHGQELATGLTAVIDYMDRLHAEAIEIFATLTPHQLQAKTPTVSGAELTTWKWLRAMAEHEIHHRGQLYTTLRLCNVETPPLYGLTELEVQERSQPE
jgi:uncharacterized damage-inducible protein DinB